MLLLAAMNRFWLVPAFVANKRGLQSGKNLAELRFHVICELLLGLMIIAIVSALGTLAPSAGG